MFSCKNKCHGVRQMKKQDGLPQKHHKTQCRWWHDVEWGRRGWLGVCQRLKGGKPQGEGVGRRGCMRYLNQVTRQWRNEGLPPSEGSYRGLMSRWLEEGGISSDRYWLKTEAYCFPWGWADWTMTSYCTSDQRRLLQVLKADRIKTSRQADTLTIRSRFIMFLAQ